jgi:hypothetical protein
MNGKPGDHPLNDILDHHLEVYGPEADDLIRKMAQNARIYGHLTIFNR